MVIHSARPQAAGTTQNNPLTTNGPKTQTPPSDVKQLDVSSHRKILVPHLSHNDRGVYDTRTTRRLPESGVEDLEPGTTRNSCHA